jgi:tetratricopeptide (TPR) repeat protein
MDGDWLVMAQTALFDIRNIGVKEVLQFATFVGSVYGAWKWWRFSKWQIANRLLEFLENDEKNIVEARKALLGYLGNKDVPIPQSDSVHPSIAKTLRLLKADKPVEAERELCGIAVLLTQSAEVGRRHMTMANEQIATILLFVGSIAKLRDDAATARGAFEEALQVNPNDAEARRALAMLELSAGHEREALEQFQRAVELPSATTLLKAEVWQQVSEIYRGREQPSKERDALSDSAESYAATGEARRAAQAFRRVGDLESRRLGFNNEARGSYRRAFDNYYKAKDEAGLDDMRARLAELGVDGSQLPTLAKTMERQLPWTWIRMTLEGVLVAAAAVLFYLSLR